VLLVDDADFLSRVSDEEFLHNFFVELLGLGVQESNVQGAIVDGLNDQTALDDSTGNLVGDAHDAGGDPTSIIVFVGVAGHPNFAGGDGGFEGKAVNILILAFNSFQVQVGGNLALLVDGAKVRVTDVLPGLLAVKDALFNAVGILGPLQTKKDALLLERTELAFNLGRADQATGKNTAVVVQQVAVHLLLLVNAAEIVGKDVDDQGAVQDATGSLLVQRDLGRDQADVGARRRTRESLDVAEETGGTLRLTALDGKELFANVFTLGSQGLSGVDVKAVKTGLHTINNTADLDGAADGGLLQHDLAINIVTLDHDESAARAFDRLGGDA
jgi:hypothetical protein